MFFGTDQIELGYIASDESVWVKVRDRSIVGCEVCGERGVLVFECKEGRWEGARVVGCEKHICEAIERFIHLS